MVELLCLSRQSSSRTVGESARVDISADTRTFVSNFFPILRTISPERNNIRLSQSVKERLSRMQSQTCLCFAEAMVFFGRSPKSAVSAVERKGRAASVRRGDGAALLGMFYASRGEAFCYTI